MVDRGAAIRWNQESNTVVDLRLKLVAPIEKKSYLPKGFSPSPWSVPCGRTRNCYDSVGHRRFRILVNIYLKKYIKAKSRSEKSPIVMDIVDTIRGGAGVERGGFVKWDPIKELWYEVGDAVAREKVGNQFRVAIANAKEDAKKIKELKGKGETTSSFRNNGCFIRNMASETYEFRPGETEAYLLAADPTNEQATPPPRQVAAAEKAVGEKRDDSAEKQQYPKSGSSTSTSTNDSPTENAAGKKSIQRQQHKGGSSTLANSVSTEEKSTDLPSRVATATTESGGDKIDQRQKQSQNGFSAPRNDNTKEKARDDAERRQHQQPKNGSSASRHIISRERARDHSYRVAMAAKARREFVEQQQQQSRNSSSTSRHIRVSSDQAREHPYRVVVDAAGNVLQRKYGERHDVKRMRYLPRVNFARSIGGDGFVRDRHMGYGYRLPTSKALGATKTYGGERYHDRSGRYPMGGEYGRKISDDNIARENVAANQYRIAFAAAAASTETHGSERRDERYANYPTDTHHENGRNPKIRRTMQPTHSVTRKEAPSGYYVPIAGHIHRNTQREKHQFSPPASKITSATNCRAPETISSAEYHEKQKKRRSKRPPETISSTCPDITTSSKRNTDDIRKKRRKKEHDADVVRSSVHPDVPISSNISVAKTSNPPAVPTPENPESPSINSSRRLRDLFLADAASSDVSHVDRSDSKQSFMMELLSHSTSKGDEATETTVVDDRAMPPPRIRADDGFRISEERTATPPPAQLRHANNFAAPLPQQHQRQYGGGGYQQ